MAIAFVGADDGRTRGDLPHKAIALAIVVVGGTAFVMFIWSGASNYAVQPRYVLPLIFVFAGLRAAARAGGRWNFPPAADDVDRPSRYRGIFGRDVSERPALPWPDRLGGRRRPLRDPLGGFPRWWLLGDGLSRARCGWAAQWPSWWR